MAQHVLDPLENIPLETNHEKSIGFRVYLPSFMKQKHDIKTSEDKCKLEEYETTTYGPKHINEMLNDPAYSTELDDKNNNASNRVTDSVEQTATYLYQKFSFRQDRSASSADVMSIVSILNDKDDDILNETIVLSPKKPSAVRRSFSTPADNTVSRSFLRTDFDWARQIFLSRSTDSCESPIPSLKARQGTCVATLYGTGHVVDIRMGDSVCFIVKLAYSGVAYLNSDAIVREIKAVVGERVRTEWGLATVEQYHMKEDMYGIALDWRWDDDHVWRMKATTKKFEKLPKENFVVQFIRENLGTKLYPPSNGHALIKDRTSRTSIVENNTESKPLKPKKKYGKALTPYGIVSVLEKRDDQFIVAKTAFGAIAYLYAPCVTLVDRPTGITNEDRRSKTQNYLHWR